jgi:hypothetical protein
MDLVDFDVRRPDIEDSVGGITDLVDFKDLVDFDRRLDFKDFFADFVSVGISSVVGDTDVGLCLKNREH